MFIGHYAVAFAAKRHAATVSLGTLFLACQLADLVWPTLVMLGIERVEIDPGNTIMTPLNFAFYPYSHSLIAAVGWSAALGLLYWALTRARKGIVIVVALVAFSHWILDAITHRPDLPLALGDSPMIGLGLWNMPVIGIGLELLLFGGAVWYYIRHTRATNRKGSIGLWSLVAFLLVIYVANILGPPPPSAMAVAWSAQALWLLVPWGYWIDRHRTLSEAPIAG